MVKDRDQATSIPSHRVEAEKSKSRKFAPHRLHVEKADNGGYSVDQHFKVADGKPGEMGAYQEPRTHVFSSFDDMHAAIPGLLGEGKADGKKAANVDEGTEGA